MTKANGVSWCQPEKNVAHQTIRGYLRIVLCLTGLYFENEQKPVRRKARVLLAIFVFGITLYQTLWRWAHFLGQGANNLITAYVLVWLSKALLAQFLLIRWQLNGNIRTILDQVVRVQLCPANALLGRIRRCVFICIFFYATFTGASTTSTVLKLTGAIPFARHLDHQIFMLYGTEYLIFVCFLVWFAGLFAMVTVLILLNISTCTVLADLEEFGAQSKKLIKLAHQTEGEEPRQEIYQQLAKLCPELIGLTRRVQQIDHIFNVYLFLMVASNVPTTILVILRFIVSFKSSLPDKWIEIGFQLPDLAFCTFELISLILMPANLYEMLHIMSNYFGEDVPIKVENRLQRRINRFVKFMCNQPGLGITVWELWIISKSMIFTIFSLVFSYLMFVLRVFNPTSLSAEVDQPISQNSTP